MIIKKAESKDLQDLAMIYDQYRVFYGQLTNLKDTELHVKKLFESEECSIFLAFSNNIIVGFSVIYYEFSGIALKLTCRLKNIYVDTKVRGQGVASKLLNICEAEALSHGANRFRTRTARDNNFAKKVFERFGFLQDEVFVTYDKNLR